MFALEDWKDEKELNRINKNLELNRSLFPSMISSTNNAQQLVELNKTNSYLLREQAKVMRRIRTRIDRK